MVNRIVIGSFILLAFWSSARGETLLERGRYLAESVVACGNCHTPQTPQGPQPGMELAGFKILDEPDMTAYAPNITPDNETGIGAWSDEEIVNAIRNGRRPDGTLIGPPMPFEYYRLMSDTDVKAIVAYLRTVPAVKNKVQRSEYRIPLPPSYGPLVESVPDAPCDDKVTYGKYLAEIAHCFSCHSPLGKKGPDIENQMGAGGMEFHGPWGTSISPNITPGPDGIANLSDHELKKRISQGVRSDGTRLLPPMGFAYYRNITNEDLDAIVAYLRTIPSKPTPK
jgi:mono/diheme cytochrome c family protein